MPRCHYEKLPDGTEYFLPDCMGGAVYGLRGCTCDAKYGPKPRKKTDREVQLQKRITELERENQKLRRQLLLMKQ